MQNTKRTAWPGLLVAALVGLLSGVLGSVVQNHWLHWGNNYSDGHSVSSESSCRNATRSLPTVEDERATEAVGNGPQAHVIAQIASATPSWPVVKAAPEANADPMLTREELIEAGNAKHQQRIDMHNREPRDSSWASRAETSLQEDISKLENFEGQLRRVDCRTSTCTAEVEWPSYHLARHSYAALQNANYTQNCGQELLLEAPPDPEIPYRTIMVFSCETAKQEGQPLPARH